MGEIVSKLTIYVTQPGDTIATIAKKFAMNEEDLLRYNPLIKHRLPKPGYPINILVKNEIETEIVPIKEALQETRRREKIAFPISDQEIILCVIFYMKEALHSKKYFPTYFPELKARIRSFFAQFTEKYSYLTSDGNIKNLRSLFDKFLDCYLQFNDVAAEKNIETFKQYQVNLRKHYDNYFRFFATIEDKYKGLSLLSTISGLFDLLNIMALKLLANKYGEAEDAFQRLITRISNAIS